MLDDAAQRANVNPLWLHHDRAIGLQHEQHPVTSFDAERIANRLIVEWGIR